MSLEKKKSKDNTLADSDSYYKYSPVSSEKIFYFIRTDIEANFW